MNQLSFFSSWAPLIVSSWALPLLYAKTVPAISHPDYGPFSSVSGVGSLRAVDIRPRIPEPDLPEPDRCWVQCTVGSNALLGPMHWPMHWPPIYSLANATLSIFNFPNDHALSSWHVACMLRGAQVAWARIGRRLGPAKHAHTTGTVQRRTEHGIPSDDPQTDVCSRPNEALDALCRASFGIGGFRPATWSLATDRLAHGHRGR